MSVGCTGGEITYDLRVDTTKAYDNLIKLEVAATKAIRVLNATTTLMRKLGLPEEASAAIRKMQALIIVAYGLAAAMMAVQAASGPYGWVMASISGASTVLGIADLAMEFE